MHPKARDAIREFSRSVRRDVGEQLFKLQLGVNIGLPDARPMAEIRQGVYELRVRDSGGTYRVFYYLKSKKGILIFHAFTKKTQKTPQSEIELGKQRLTEM